MNQISEFAVRFKALSSSMLLLVTFPAFAQYSGYSYGEADNVSYAQAQVVRVEPVYETIRTRVPEERCGEQEQQVQDSNANGTILGAVVGGALGNQVGKGDGRRAATIAGAVIGGVVGRNVDQRTQSGGYARCQMVEVEREERRIAGYDVEYTYQGKTYMSRIPYDPGDRLRVRVSVTPADEPTAYN